ncbi:MAG: sensor histidine kinase [Actinomycetota bacterium]
MRGALDELVDNAVKFSPDGGIVTISVRTLGEAKPAVEISVRDQGIGIDPAKMKTVFDDFHQVDGSPTRQFGGLGLGLAFVRRVAGAHGGRVEIASEHGRGSTFSLILPARAPKQQRAPRKGASRSRVAVVGLRNPRAVSNKRL